MSSFITWRKNIITSTFGTSENMCDMIDEAMEKVRDRFEIKYLEVIVAIVDKDFSIEIQCHNENDAAFQIRVINDEFYSGLLEARDRLIHEVRKRVTFQGESKALVG